MKLSLFGIVVEVYKLQELSLKERRRRAKLVLERSKNSNSVISRIKAVRSLGLSVFPELRYHNEELGVDSVGLKEAKEWVELSFLDDGKGDIA